MELGWGISSTCKLKTETELKFLPTGKRQQEKPTFYMHLSLLMGSIAKFATCIKILYDVNSKI